MTSNWKRAAIAWAAIVALLFVAFWQSWREMIALWSNTDSYTHGPIVPLISGWLIWRLRSVLRTKFEPSPSLVGAVLILLCALAWAVGDVLQVAALRHFAVMSMVIAATCAVFGLQIAKALMFPLAFLLFAVPFGDFLTDPMMEQTADFTVLALQWTGIPVYREARHIQIPTGNWAVVEACSGTRYLIASVMLGALFAYLFYKTARKRVLFVLASILVPIIGNWVRAYLIVLIGHLTQNKYGVGADHVLFGWVFFGVLIYAMFAVGARWREDVETEPIATTKSIKSAPQVSTRKWFQPGVAALLAACIPLLVAPKAIDVTTMAIQPLVTPERWRAVDGKAWRPAFSGTRAEQSAALYSPEGGAVSVYRGYFAGQRNEFRMIRFGNNFVDHETTGNASISNTTIDKTFTGASGTITEIRIPQGAQTRLVRGAYLVGSTLTGSAYRAKLLLAMNQLTGRGDRSAVVIWSALAESDTAARKLLDEFENAYRAQLFTERKPS